MQELKKMQEEEDREQRRRQKALNKQVLTFTGSELPEIPNELQEPSEFNEQLKMALQISPNLKLMGTTNSPYPHEPPLYTHDLDLSKIQEQPSHLNTNDENENDDNTPRINKSPRQVGIAEMVQGDPVEEDGVPEEHGP